MCEFTVYLESSGKKEKVTKGVVKAKLKDGAVSLMDAAGVSTRVDGASILVVDTLMQELILKKT